MPTIKELLAAGKFVRLFGASDVHATSEALADAARRVARVLSLQMLTNFGFALLVSGALFALGMPNAVLWGLLAGALRFIPFVGAALGAVLPTVIAFAVMPGWLQPFLVLGSICALIGLLLLAGWRSSFRQSSGERCGDPSAFCSPFRSLFS